MAWTRSRPRFKGRGKSARRLWPRPAPCCSRLCRPRSYRASRRGGLGGAGGGVPCVVFLLATVGARGVGGGNRGEFEVRLQDGEMRVFSLGRWWRGAIEGEFDSALRGNFPQRDMMGEVRKLFKQ